MKNQESLNQQFFLVPWREEENNRESGTLKNVSPRGSGRCYSPALDSRHGLRLRSRYEDYVKHLDIPFIRRKEIFNRSPSGNIVVSYLILFEE